MFPDDEPEDDEPEKALLLASPEVHTTNLFAKKAWKKAKKGIKKGMSAAKVRRSRSRAPFPGDEHPSPPPASWP